MKCIHTICLLFVLSWSYEQVTLSGTVTNENNEPLIGASVFLHSTQYATITDERGIFEIKDIPPDAYRLKSTFIGYKSFTEYLELDSNTEIDIVLKGTPFELGEIEVLANRLDENMPFSYVEYGREEVEVKNLAQDLPFLVEHTPSMVVTSDAGAGVGYTGMRIRGSDATRINVTINGVPLNDSESHGVFWVNMPDFASSVSNIQIQRGVGPSTNGAAAFGGTINLNTNEINQNPYVRFNGSYGSFNTQKLGVSFGTGLMNNAFTIDGRYSIIKSDGFIDRASSDLNSFYISLAKVGENHSLRFNVFSGNEVTYQAWNGVPEAKLFGTDEELLAHYFNNSNGDYETVADSVNLFDSGRSYNAYTYENQVDDYQQDHYQLIYSLQPKENLSVNTTLHYTQGKGFFETLRRDDELADYGLSDIINMDGSPIESGNLIRRKWLDNDFYGAIVNMSYDINDKTNLLIGGAYNVYKGDHFGKVDSIENVTFTVEDRQRDYYRSFSEKTDFNVYGKLSLDVTDRIGLFADAQYRTIGYDAEGTDDDLSNFLINETYNFFNPKFGLNYQIDNNSLLYLSYAKANREPVRSDFIDAKGIEIPKPESLHDFELGFRKGGNAFSLEANLYYMLYRDQLVLTGAVNNVGAPVRTNVDNSYRAGVEINVMKKFTPQLTWYPNLTLSRNKVEAFTEIIFDFTDFNNIVEINNEFNDTDIAFSPSIISGSRLEYQLSDGFNINWLSKYVGKQFLDNTSNDARSLSAYWVNDLLLTYRPQLESIENIEFKFLLNNFLNHEFESNGYTYSYGFEGIITENYLYPQAGTNFLLGVEVQF